MRKFKELLVGIGTILSIIVGILCTIFSVIASAVVMRFTPVIVVILIVLELCSITTFGIGNILLYGLLAFVGSFILLFITTIVVAFIAA